MKHHAVFFSLIALLSSLLMALAILSSCSSMPKPPNVTVMQVWQSGRLIADGVVVGDGNKVLTILDYAHVNADGLSVVFNDSSYEATILILDPRTGATLLDIATALPAVQLANSNTIKEGQQAYVSECYESDPGKPLVRDTRQIRIGQASAFGYHISLIDGDPISQGGAFPGAPIYDKGGSLLGLAGNSFWGPIPPPLPPGYFAPVISSANLVGLLAPDAAQQSWAQGPAGYAVLTRSTAMTYLDVPANYNRVSRALQEILGEIGKPLETSALQQSYPWFIRAPDQGSLLVVYYAAPVTLRSADGTALVQTKRLNITWGIDQPNRLIYGDNTVSGGFELGDISNLLAALG